MDERVPWDQYFMNIAQVVASRSTCPRKFVGSVIVRDRTILSTGYNGSIRGMPHCTEVGHMMENDHCVATIHAEANAIIQAAKNGVMIDGGDDLRHRQPVLDLLQADHQRRPAPHRLWRVLSRRAHLHGRGAAGGGPRTRSQSRTAAAARLSYSEPSDGFRTSRKPHAEDGARTATGSLGRSPSSPTRIRALCSQLPVVLHFWG